jgi:hypothetical protein
MTDTARYWGNGRTTHGSPGRGFALIDADDSLPGNDPSVVILSELRRAKDLQKAIGAAVCEPPEAVRYRVAFRRFAAVEDGRSETQGQAPVSRRKLGACP